MPRNATTGSVGTNREIENVNKVIPSRMTGTSASRRRMNLVTDAGNRSAWSASARTSSPGRRPLTRDFPYFLPSRKMSRMKAGLKALSTPVKFAFAAN